MPEYEALTVVKVKAPNRTAALDQLLRKRDVVEVVRILEGKKP
jgi:hypothetical protein